MDNIICGVYKITNKITGQSYIGASNNILNRFYCHKINSSNKTLKEEFKKFGLDNFSFEVIEECDLLELKAKENYYIDLYNNNSKLYNVSKKSTYINKNTKHCQKNSIEFGHIDTFLIYKECQKQGITKPKKQDLVNCAFMIANNKLNEMLK